MAALNTLRAKFSADRAEALAARRREDGLKTFEWKGPGIPCKGCGIEDRNLNSEEKCTACVTGIVPAPPTIVTKPPVNHLDKWPFRTAPRPALSVQAEHPIGKVGSKETLKVQEAELLTHTVGHSKFYSMARYGWIVALRWGKIGGEGQEDTKAFNNETEAILFYRKQRSSKEAKGYKSVCSVPGA